MNNLTPNGQNRLGNITSNIQNKITNLPQIVKENFNNAAQVIDTGYNKVKTNVTSGLAGFNQQANVGFGSTQQFLSSNTIIAKFAFVILVIIVFLFLLSLGVKVLSYFFTPVNNPMIINGILEGNNDRTITVDPTLKTSKPILRSNNQKTGLEFTWSVWLFIKNIRDDIPLNHIFNKGTGGDNDFNKDTGLATMNCPGLYLTKNATLKIVLDSTNNTENMLEVPNIPFNKWFHVAIRVENTILDVYINGTLTERSISRSVPRQNFYDTHVCKKGGFQGQLSNLQYYNSALSVIQINNIVFWGPNLTQSSLPSYNTTDYLSPAWYSTNNSDIPNNYPQI